MSAPAPDSQEVPDEQAPTLPPPTSVETREGDGAATLLRERPAVPGHEILGELGRGGMGVVYKARHIRLQRLVALKMILAGGHAGASELARFRGEAEALARLQHPHIVQIFEAGEVNGLPFLSLEFVDGGSLAAKLTGTPWSPAEAAQLVETLARAVAAAHQAGIVHRDLKPANVLLNADGVPKITDFGLAKRLDSQTAHTQSGAILGTPSYMAPEQAEAKGQAVGPAADVYALGAILYELLTGRPPFKAATPLETVLQVVADEPVPPRKLQPEVPRDLQAVCLKCLAKDPRQRYAGADLLAEDLRRFRENEPVSAKYREARRRRWWWHDRVAVGVVGLVLLALLGGVALVLYRSSLAPTPPGPRSAQPVNPAGLFPPFQMPKMPPLNLPKQAGTLIIWNAATGEALATEKGTDGYVSQMAFSPDGKRLLTNSHQGNEVKVRDTTTGKVLFEVKGIISFFAWSPDGGRFITAGRYSDDPATILSGENNLRVWDAKNGKNLLSFGKSRGPSQISALALSHDGRRLAAVNAGEANVIANEIKLLPPALKVWDPQTGQEVFSKPLKNLLFQVVFSPDDKRLFSASGSDEAIDVWDVATGRKEAVPFRGQSMVFNGDGTRLATFSIGEPVKVWNAMTGQELYTVEGVMPAFSPDGRRLATSPPVKVWDATTGQELYSVDGANPAFSPDGRRLVTIASGKGTIWNAETGKELFTLRETPHRIILVAYSPDGKRLAGACQDGTLFIWDAANGERLHTLKGHPKTAIHLLFSPDGQRLASASYDGQVQGDAAPEKK